MEDLAKGNKKKALDLYWDLAKNDVNKASNTRLRSFFKRIYFPTRVSRTYFYNSAIYGGASENTSSGL